jgi:hypothetical protein
MCCVKYSDVIHQAPAPAQKYRLLHNYAGEEMCLRCRFHFCYLSAVRFVYRYANHLKARFQMIILKLPNLDFQCLKLTEFIPQIPNPEP